MKLKVNFIKNKSSINSLLRGCQVMAAENSKTADAVFNRGLCFERLNCQKRKFESLAKDINVCAADVASRTQKKDERWVASSLVFFDCCRFQYFIKSATAFSTVSICGRI